METELKLLLDPAAAALLAGHPLLRRHALGKSRVQQLTSIYFDTPDGYFRRRDAGLRVRLQDGRWIQTLKADGQAAAGLHQRQEWESPVAGALPDLDALAELAGPRSKWGRRLRSVGLGAQLAPIFSTRFRRTLWQLRLAQGELVELALDQGRVMHAATALPISEIELELKSGAPAGLFDFALELLQALPLRVSNVSKAERGYALLAAPAAAQPALAAPLTLAPGATPEQGWQEIVGNCLAQIQGNEEGVMHGSDPESVHQMRVGLRRLRCAIRLFGGIAPCPLPLQAELQWLLGVLGAARDWEVVAGMLDALADAEGAPQRWQGVRQAAHRQALRQRQQAGRALGSVRYTAFLLGLGGWLQRGAAPPLESGRAVPLAGFAAHLLRECRKTLQKRLRRLPDGTPAARHRLRIAAKKLRYASEFFRSLHQPEPMQAQLQALSALQDRLGRLNDAALAARLLEQLAHGHPELAYSAGMAHGILTARAERQLRSLGRHGRRCAAARVPALP